MPSRPSLSLLTAGLGTAVIVTFGAAPALADHEQRQLPGSTSVRLVDAATAQRFAAALADDPYPEYGAMWVGAEQLIRDPVIVSLIAAHHAMIDMRDFFNRPRNPHIVAVQHSPRAIELVNRFMRLRPVRRLVTHPPAPWDLPRALYQLRRDPEVRRVLAALRALPEVRRLLRGDAPLSAQPPTRVPQR
jgi:hypothetical protein